MRARGLSLPDLAITLVLVFIFAWELWQVQLGKWPFRAALFPVITGVVVLTLLALKLLLDLRTARQPADVAPAPVGGTKLETEGQSLDLIEEDEAAEAELEDIFATAPRPVWVRALGWMALFFGMVWTLGMMVTIPLFAFAYLLVAGREKPWVAVLYAVVSWLFIYFLFGRVLNIVLPESVFKSLLFPVAG